MIGPESVQPERDDVRYTLQVEGAQEGYTFANKNDLVDFIAWMVTGYGKLTVTITNVKKNARIQARQVTTGSLHMPAVNERERR